MVLPFCGSYSLGGSQCILLLPIGTIRFPEWYPAEGLVKEIDLSDEPACKRIVIKQKCF